MLRRLVAVHFVKELLYSYPLYQAVKTHRIMCSMGFYRLTTI